MAVSKQVTLFVAALLFLICSTGQSARPEPGANDQKSQGFGVALKSSSATTVVHQERGMDMEKDQGEQKDMRECEGGEGLEECLMRRTLVAHTDYIYTQRKHN